MLKEFNKIQNPGNVQYRCLNQRGLDLLIQFLEYVSRNRDYDILDWIASIDSSANNTKTFSDSVHIDFPIHVSRTGKMECLILSEFEFSYYESIDKGINFYNVLWRI